MTVNGEMPSSAEAEDAVIGAVLNDNSIHDSVVGYINEETLFKQTSKVLWRKISEMIKKGHRVDVITITQTFNEFDKKIGLSAHYMSDLFQYSVVKEWAIVYAKAIYEKYLFRLIIEKASNIQKMAQNSHTRTYDILTDTHSLIGELIEIKPGESFEIDAAMTDVIKSIETGENNLIKTGFSGLDDLSGGMTRGEITIVGGRPGHGKTTFTINLIKGLIENGKKVLLFNREMTNTEMLKKLIALESGKLSYTMIRRGVFGFEEMAELNRVKQAIVDKYSADKFIMFDNLKDFASGASEVKRFKPDVIIDDYIQLIRPDNPKEQRRLQLEKLVNDYKWLAKSSQACAVLLSQLNRQIESRPNQRPILSDLAESGAIEQVAENVWFVFYDYKINFAKSKVGANGIEIIGSKVRYGNSGGVKLGFDGDKVKLYNTMEEFKEARFNA